MSDTTGTPRLDKPHEAWKDELSPEAYAVLYAPEKKITLKKGPGDPDFYGAITGKEVKLEDDASLHFDKALSSPSTTEAGTVTVVSARHF